MLEINLAQRGKEYWLSQRNLANLCAARFSQQSAGRITRAAPASRYFYLHLQCNTLNHKHFLLLKFIPDYAPAKYCQLSFTVTSWKCKRPII